MSSIIVPILYKSLILAVGFYIGVLFMCVFSVSKGRKKGNE